MNWKSKRCEMVQLDPLLNPQEGQDMATRLVLRKMQDIKVGDRVGWCGVIREVSGVTKISLKGLAVSMTVDSLSLTLDLPDVDLVRVEVKDHPLESTTRNATDSLKCEERLLE